MGIIQRQGIKNTISSYAGIILGFVSLIVIQPKFLKPEEIGLARVMFAFSVLIASFIPLGSGNMTIKYFPHFRNHKNAHYGFFWFMLIFPLVGFIVSAFGLIIFKEFIIAQFRRESPLVIDYFNYIYPFSFFIAFSTIISTYLISLFKTTVPSYLSDVYVRLGYIALIFAYYFHIITLHQFIGGYVGIYALQLVLLVIYLWIEDKPSFDIDWDFFKQTGLKEMIGFSFLLSFAPIAALGLKTVDSILIGKFLPLGFVGIYTIASFIPTIIETPLNALDRIISAKVAHAIVENDIEDVKDVFYKSVKYLSLLGGLLFVGITCNITDLLSLVGKSYQQGIEVVWIISIGSFINMLGGANSSIILYSSKYWQGSLLLVLLVIITFANNMLLIPIFGINGAAMSTAISALLYAAIKFFIVYNKFRFQPYNMNTVKTLSVVAICLAVFFFIPDLHSHALNIVVRSLILGGLYVTLAYFLNIVPEFHKYLPWGKK